jgi:hypothetical protein
MQRIQNLGACLFLLILSAASLALSQTETKSAKNGDKKTTAKSGQSISATFDKTGQHPGTAPITGPATVTCTNATSNIPNPQPKPSCFITAPGFTGNLDKGQKAGTSGAGTVTLNCNGQGDFLSCTANVQ